MACDEGVAERLREMFAGFDDFTEKKMFGGIAFMHAGNLCCGLVDEVLTARVGSDGYADALKMPHAREMNFTGKAMKGFVYVDPPGFAENRDLQAWVERCHAFTRTLPPIRTASRSPPGGSHEAGSL